MTLKKCSAALSICLEHFVTLPLPCAHTLCLEHRIATHLNPSSVRSRVVYIRTCRKRSALLITDTDERLIASAAKSGLSNSQVRLGRPMRAVCPPRLCRHSTKATAKRCGDRINAKRTRFSRIHTEVFYGKKADNVGHCVTLSVRSMTARDSFFLRVSIGSGAIPAPLSPARNPTGPPN